jgi:hypothetical protein
VKQETKKKLIRILSEIIETIRPGKGWIAVDLEFSPYRYYHCLDRALKIHLFAFEIANPSKKYHDTIYSMYGPRDILNAYNMGFDFSEGDCMEGLRIRYGEKMLYPPILKKKFQNGDK